MEDSSTTKPHSQYFFLETKDQLSTIADSIDKQIELKVFDIQDFFKSKLTDSKVDEYKEVSIAASLKRILQQQQSNPYVNVYMLELVIGKIRADQNKSHFAFIGLCLGQEFITQRLQLAFGDDFTKQVHFFINQPHQANLTNWLSNDLLKDCNAEQLLRILQYTCVVTRAGIRKHDNLQHIARAPAQVVPRICEISLNTDKESWCCMEIPPCKKTNKAAKIGIMLIWEGAVWIVQDDCLTVHGRISSFSNNTEIQRLASLWLTAVEVAYNDDLSEIVLLDVLTFGGEHALGRMPFASRDLKRHQIYKLLTTKWKTSQKVTFTCPDRIDLTDYHLQVLNSRIAPIMDDVEEGYETTVRFVNLTVPYDQLGQDSLYYMFGLQDK